MHKEYSIEQLWHSLYTPYFPINKSIEYYR